MDTSPHVVYKVSDLSEAAAILCIGFELVTTEQDNKGRVYFVFPNSTELQNAIKAYWGCELKVTARYYADAIKTLKNVIYRDR